MAIAIPQTAAAHPTQNEALERDLEELAAHKQILGHAARRQESASF